MPNWLVLSLAIVLEVAGTSCMKLSGGFERVLPSILMFVFYGLSFVSLTFALKHYEVGVAYAIWSGLGTLLIAIIGIYFFQESVSLIKVASIGLIVAGVVGLNLGGAH